MPILFSYVRKEKLDGEYIMKIYPRDYTTLTQEEIEEWEVLKEKEIVRRIGKGDLAIRKSLYREYPVAVRHYESLFPNNHLDIVDLQKVVTTNGKDYVNNQSSILKTVKIYYTLSISVCDITF